MYREDQQQNWVMLRYRVQCGEASEVRSEAAAVGLHSLTNSLELVDSPRVVVLYSCVLEVLICLTLTVFELPVPRSYYLAA